MAGTVTSSTATLSVNVPPAITTPPSSQTVNQGQNAPFSVVANGTAPLSYQWKFNAANITGATTTSYTLSNAQASNAGSYTVLVTNMAGTVTSSAAVLGVNIPPSITTQPSSQTVAQDATATFSVVAAGTAPLYYQWSFNGSNIAGATASSYVIYYTHNPYAGGYSVVVTNMAGTVTSSTANLLVNYTATAQDIDVFAQGTPSGSSIQDINWNADNHDGWTAWESRGDAGTGKPAVVSYSPGILNVFQRGTNNALWTKYYTASQGWVGWSSLGGNMASDPCTCTWRGGTNWIFVFYKGTGGKMIERYYNTITGWESGEITNSVALPMIAGGNITCCSYAYGYINFFCRGTNNALWTYYYSPAGWSTAWTSLAGTISSDPGAAAWGMSHIDVFANTTSSGMYHIQFTTSGWSAWSGIGLVAPGANAPCVCSYASGILNVFARGTNNAIWTKYYASGAWSGSWTSLGDTMSGDPCCISWTTGN